MLKRGVVYLVGAGPGARGLLTLRGRECLEQAEVVIYDYLINPELLRYVPEGAEFISTGRKGTPERLSQGRIINIMIERAKKGKSIVRLKGGDPFVFGRGGEEALALAKAGISFEVIPGVTAAIAVPEYAGIPLTHREFSSVVFLTGHEDPSKTFSMIDWNAISRIRGTLVFYMSMRTLPRIVNKLITLGKSPDTPAAVIHWGSMPLQMTVRGILGRIVDDVAEKGITSPSVLVVGDVVRLSERINWFEKKPLFGKTIAITRAENQAGELADAMESLGANVIRLPMIRIVPPRAWGPVDRALRRIKDYKWIIFTSVNGVQYFFGRMRTLGIDVRELGKAKIIAIGPRTAGNVRARGLIVDSVPSEYRAEALAGLFGDDLKGLKILLPRARVARDVLPEELRKRGADVDVVPVYETVQPEVESARLMRMFRNREVDLITFTSSSTVRNFVKKIGQSRLTGVLDGVAVACIGPVTAATAGKYGIGTDIMPREYTISGLVREVEKFFEEKRG